MRPGDTEAKKMQRVCAAAVIMAVLVLVACSAGGPEAGDEARPSGQGQEQGQPLFEDDFESGEQDEWSEQDEKPTPGADEPATEPAEGETD